MVHANPASAKTVLRLQMRDLRKRLASEAPDAANEAAARLPADLAKGAAIVSGYRPRGAEIDPWPVMRAFALAGATLALPVAFDRDSPLEFRTYVDGDALKPDAFNILAPSAAAAVVEPDLVIAPLLAFDRSGNRMGHGAGHYDRTLEGLRARRPLFVLGLAYAGQQVARVPAEPHDQRLDAILTEKAYIEASKD
jgi:5-formyltetrahydrofolate cyclo-ligase